MSEDLSDLNLFEEELDEISLLNEEKLKKEDNNNESKVDSEKVKVLKQKIFPLEKPKTIFEKNNVKKDKNSINSFIPIIGFFVMFVFLLLIVFSLISFFTPQEVNSIKFTSNQEEQLINNSFNQEQENVAEKQPCPFECCSPRIYIEKKCPEPLICSNNSCKLKPCVKECCVEEGVQKKPCPNNLECVNNECLKPECPFMCCMKTDKEYREKKCIGGLRCVGRTCSIIG